MGDLVRNILCAELMGRYSNLVLVQNGKIIDALKRVDFEDSDVRQLLPGLPYTTPPKPARPDFLAVSSASIVAAACQRDLPVADALNKTVAGVGPVVCREAAWRAFDGEHLLANELTEAQKVRLMAAIDELKEIYDAGGCHLDSNLVMEALGAFDLNEIDILFIENVGNLVCPVEFDCGEDAKIALLSVTEGDDKPEKYPLLFNRASAMVLNKIDLLPYVDFDVEVAARHARHLNADLALFEVSCRTGEGLEKWYSWLRQAAKAKKGA